MCCSVEEARNVRSAVRVTLSPIDDTVAGLTGSVRQQLTYLMLSPRAPTVARVGSAVFHSRSLVFVTILLCLLPLVP